MSTMTIAEQADAAVSPQRTPYGLAILVELNRSKHIYEGTVPAHVKAARRRRNKAARIARRAAR